MADRYLLLLRRIGKLPVLVVLLFVFITPPVIGGNASPLEVQATYYTKGTSTLLKLVLINVEAVPVQLSQTEMKIFQKIGASEIQVYNESVMGGTVPAGSPTSPGQLIVTFPVPFTPNVRGEYRMETGFQALNDIDPTNNYTDFFKFAEPGKLCSSSDANNPNAGQTGDPVSGFTGEFHYTPECDLFLGGPNPVFLRRYYASRMANDMLLQGSFGTNWSHNFDMKLLLYTEHAEVICADGKYTLFHKEGTGFVNWLPADIPYRLVESGSEYRFLDPLTNKVYVFNGNGQLIEIDDGVGNILSLTYDSGGNLESVSDGLGRTLIFTYTSGGKVSTVSDGVRTVTYGYTGENLTSYINAANNTTTYAYDQAVPADGLLATISYPAGNSPYTNTWLNGQVVSQEDALGNTTTFSYPPQWGGVTTITDEHGNTYKEEHDANGNLVKFTDEMGNEAVIVYDSLNRPTEIIDREGASTKFEYDDDCGRIRKLTDPEGRSLTKQFVSSVYRGLTQYRVQSITYPDASMMSLSYTNGSVAQITDKEGRTWNYSRNARGQVTNAQDPDGSSTVYSYHPSGAMASKQDAKGNTVMYSYDNLFRVNSVTKGGLTTAYQYDALNRVVQITDPMSNTTQLTYDANGRLASNSDFIGNSALYAYDDMDRTTLVTLPNGYTAALEYDAVHGPVRLSDPNGTLREAMYDTRGYVSEIKDANNRTRTYTYDDEGRMLTMTTPMNRTYRFEYDDNGNITRITTPMSNAFAYAYSEMNNPLSMTDPMGRTLRVERTDEGRVSMMYMPGDSIFAAIVRNVFGQTTTATDANGNYWTYSYDELGRLTGKTDPIGNTWSYEYNASNRLTKATFPGSNGDVTYTYNSRGQVTSAAYSQGGTIPYGYDENGNLVSSKDVTIGYNNIAKRISCNGLTFTRNARGLITAMEYEQGKALTYTYDAEGNLTQVADWLGGTMTLMYDDDGHVTTLQRPSGVNTAYSYDDDGRLTGISEGSLSSIALTLDGAGRTLSAVRDVPLQAAAASMDNTYAYDAASQVSGVTYSAPGRVANDGARSYTWDARDLLTEYMEGSNTVQCTYDGLGNRLTRTDGTGTAGWVWSYVHRPASPVLQTDGTGPVWYHVFTPNGRLLYSIDASGARRYYHYDERGNTIFTTDDAGAVVAKYAYAPFGAMLAEENGAGNPFTFMGRYGVQREPGSDLYYARARYYDAGTGRFLTRDPAADAFSKHRNRYAYANNNPMTYVDYTGGDPAPAQVLVEARIINANRYYLDELGDVFTKQGESFVKSSGSATEPDPPLPIGNGTGYTFYNRYTSDFTTQDDAFGGDLDGYLLIGSLDRGRIDGSYLPRNYDNDIPGQTADLPLYRDDLLTTLSRPRISATAPEGNTAHWPPQSGAAATGGKDLSSGVTAILNRRLQNNWQSLKFYDYEWNTNEAPAQNSYFWFFDQTNVESVIKVLDSAPGAINNGFWMFYGAATNVEALIQVTDTEAGTTSVFRNPLDRPFEPILDTQAFSTCP